MFRQVSQILTVPYIYEKNRRNKKIIVNFKENKNLINYVCRTSTIGMRIAHLAIWPSFFFNFGKY